MPFRPGEGRPPMNISESEIRYAMEPIGNTLNYIQILKQVRPYSNYIRTKPGKAFQEQPNLGCVAIMDY